MKQHINTDKAPKAIGTYSQAVKVGDMIYCSGQIALLPETMQIIEGDFAERVRQVWRNLSAVLEAAGASLNHLVKVNVYLTSMDNFAIVNQVMAEFVDEPYPARAAVAVKELPKGTDIEIEAIATL